MKKVDLVKSRFLKNTRATAFNNLNNYLSRYSRKLNSGEVVRSQHKKGSYDFIPMDYTDSLMEDLWAIKLYLMRTNPEKFTFMEAYPNIYPGRCQHPRFVDLGSGFGNIIAVADAMGFDCIGVENDIKIKKWMPTGGSNEETL